MNIYIYTYAVCIYVYIYTYEKQNSRLNRCFRIFLTGSQLFYLEPPPSLGHVGVVFLVAKWNPNAPTEFQKIPETEIFADNRQLWFEKKSKQTGHSLDVLLKQDQLLLERPPKDYRASYRKNVGMQLWKGKCVSCHGFDGKPHIQFDPAPRNLGAMGMKMGFFFGGDKMRMGLMNKIRTGKGKEQETIGLMPAFAEQLSNDQIWSIVAFVEQL